MKLPGKIALVTGAGRGIGRQISLAMAQEGADVIASDIDPLTAEQVSQEIEKKGRRSLSVGADVSKWDQVCHMIDLAYRKFGRIDILVNNAGILHRALLKDMSVDDWDKTIDVNLKSVFLCSKAVSERMMEQRYGRIICMSSIAAQQGGAQASHYSASKAGIIGFVRALSLELAPYQITVNAIAPGMIGDTPMGRDGIAHFGEELLKRIPCGRYGKPEDIASGVLFLASEDAQYITGHTLSINGGRFMS
jgi:3-oxoacyl-[acyl-carrier protein] reductase